MTTVIDERERTSIVPGGDVVELLGNGHFMVLEAAAAVTEPVSRSAGRRL